MNKLVVANLKMYMDYDTTLDYVNKVNKNIIVCPSYIYIPYFLNKTIVGAQDCYIKDNGSFTGNISPLHLKQMGVKYVIIGHSERRKSEDDKLINEKVLAAIRNKLKVILCVGENVSEDKFRKIKDQLTTDLNGVNVNNIIIAYEPIWAIGTDIIPTNEQIAETSKFIKSFIRENFNNEIKVLYGGSIDINNISTLNEIEEIDGFLIGRASLNYETINKIYEITSK